MKTIHIIYETIARELEIMTMLKLELIKRGYKVKLICIAKVGIKSIKFFNYKNPDLVISSNIGNGEKNLNHFLGNYRIKNFHVINMAVEQVYSETWFKSNFNKPNGINLLIYQVCWGPERVKNLNYDKKYESKLLKIGSIQQDFNLPQFNNFYFSQEGIAKKYKLDIKKDWILFISSFSYIKFDNKKLQQLKEQSNTDADYYYKFSIKTREVLIKWFEKFVASHPNYEFIYRPHPDEANDPIFIKLKNKYKNFHVISDYSVRQWIKVCDIINTWTSTSIVEAYYLHKNCSILRPVDVKREEEPLIMVDADMIKTYEEFEKYNENEYKTKSFPVKPETIKKFYYNDNINPVYMKLCDCVEEILKKEDEKVYFDIEIETSLRTKFKRLILRLFAFLLHHGLFPKIQFKHDYLRFLMRVCYKSRKSEKEMEKRLKKLYFNDMK